jgi:outer membrane protein OmpA-like peptidoglycan-associated protein
VVALGIAAPGVAAAEGFQLDAFETRADGTGRLGAPLAPALPPGGFSVSLTGLGVGRPLVFQPAAAADPRVEAAVIEQRISATLAAAFAPWRFLALHGALPLTLHTGLGDYGDTHDALAARSTGDARLGLTLSLLRIFGLDRPLGLDLAVDATTWLPTGDEAALTGEGQVRVQPTLILDGRWGGLGVSASAGWHVREVRAAYNQRLDDELRVALSAEVGLPLGFALQGAAHGVLPTTTQPDPLDPTRSLSADAIGDAVAEGLAGLGWRSDAGLVLAVAGGRGVTETPGSPAWRGLFTVGYTSPEAVDAPDPGPDRDADGVLDADDDCPYEAEDLDGERDADGCPEGPPAGYAAAAGANAGPPLAPLPPLSPLTDTDGDGRTDAVDACPTAPEDPDGFADADGCPEPDDDADGVLDAADRCPAEAEIVNGTLDADGCPDVGADADADGVEDLIDACPLLPETPNAIRDEDGCPEADTAPLPALPPLPLGADLDHDRLPDAEDACPAAPEDVDGLADADGCPDPDDDGDGVLDASDKCPRVAESLDGFEDADGCPDLGPDADQDGVADATDACPGLPETLDGVRDDDGCPETLPAGAQALVALPPLPVEGDPDADGQIGVEDACPLAAEDVDGFADLDGCPDPDDDGDGLADGRDTCPHEAETQNAWLDEDGCADAIPEAMAGLVGNVGGVQFVIKQATLTPASLPVLERVAVTLGEHPTWRLAIEGHTDDAGERAENIDLSGRRAQAVRDALVSRGVSPDRLIVQGFGPDRPIASNRTRAGRSANRRVELHYLAPETTP